jgi:hypothetical protein
MVNNRYFFRSLVIMKKAFILLSILGLAVWVVYGSAQAEMGTLLAPSAQQTDTDISPSIVPNAPATDPDISPPAPDNAYLPLRELIRRYSGRTGIRIKFSQGLRDDEQVLSKLYSSQDDAWLEDFSRVEYDNQQTGKKEIILLKSRYYDASKIPDPATPKPRNPGQRVNPRTSPRAGSQGDADAEEDRDENDLGLSREKLFKLMRFPFKGPFTNEWFEDGDFRRFMDHLQIHSSQAFEDRRVVMKIRNEARKQFRKLRARK